MKDRKLIIQHINSFNPTISHHRRVHASKKKYLPSDVTITAMHKNFNDKNPGMCSYDLYRKIVSVDLNISFAHLGHEECESCEIFKFHSKDNPTHTKENPDPDCKMCSAFTPHRERYTASRKLYDEHKKLLSSEYHRRVSTDLQKVIMLPHIDMFKEVIFCPRLIAFNESFVPIGEHSNVKPLAAVWYEATSGRKKGDIISLFINIFW